MKLFRVFIITAVMFTALSQLILAADSLNYVCLTPLIKKYGLRHEREPLTGRETFSGNGYRLILCPGMSTMMVNNKLTILKQQTKLINGAIALPASDINKIEALFKVSEENLSKRLSPLKKIVIDPGHGGKFRGTQGRNGLREKDVVLDIGLKLRTLLQVRGIKVVMTRETDRHLAVNLNRDLDRRVAIANREQPDLFISIHANWCRKPSVHGFEIYYSPNKAVSKHTKLGHQKTGSYTSLSREVNRVLAYALRDEYKKQTLDLAKEIQKEFYHRSNNRGIRKAGFRVIKKTECPSVLVEIEYMSNKKQCRKLGQKAYRQQIAEELSRAILKFGDKKKR